MVGTMNKGNGGGAPTPPSPRAMRRRAGWLVAGAVAVVLAAAAGWLVHDRARRAGPAAAAAAPARAPRVREPAVAGLFYPDRPEELARAIDALVAAANPAPVGGAIKGLVCPHAGYQYSGLTAAFAYKLLAGRDIRTVILLAPSHHAHFRGAAVCGADVYRTPLGDVPVARMAAGLARVPPFVPEPRVPLRRPEWWAQASHPAPPAGDDTPETWEHAGEVQVPFLQKVLGDFELVPVVFGEADPEQAARGIAGLLDERTLVIASTDLSHYHPYDQARALDGRCVKAICDLDTEAIKDQQACGLLPVRTLMHLAKLKGWRARLLDQRNSGDVTGDRSQGVVGYAAIAFQPAEPPGLSAGERRELLELARRTIRGVVEGGGVPEVAAGALPARLGEPKGCFVTLTEAGRLRGCIGHVTARMPLYQAVIENARDAAVRDPRFEPVRAGELGGIGIEISVLTEPRPLEFSSPEDLLDKLQPDLDGVVLQVGGRAATYLPQVWRQLPHKEDFLNTLAEKAGCPPGAWCSPGARVLTYRVECFREGEY